MKFVNLSAPSDRAWHIWPQESVGDENRTADPHENVGAIGPAWCGETWDEEMGGVYPLRESRLSDPPTFAEQAHDHRVCDECAKIARSGDWRLRSWYEEWRERYADHFEWDAPEDERVAGLGGLFRRT